jgi:hypothetical protein
LPCRNLESSKKQPLATYKEAVDNCKQYNPGHQKRFCPRDKEQVSIWVQNLSFLMSFFNIICSTKESSNIEIFII